MLVMSSQRRIAAVVGELAAARERGDIDACTWNIETVEGKGAVRDMRASRRHASEPAGFQMAAGEDASDDGGGVLAGWITFETAVARGFGHIRRENGKIWTRSASMSELEGHETPLGFERPLNSATRRRRHSATPPGPLTTSMPCRRRSISPPRAARSGSWGSSDRIGHRPPAPARGRHGC